MGREDEAERRLREGRALGARGVTPVLAHWPRQEADELCIVDGVEAPSGGRGDELWPGLQWPRTTKVETYSPYADGCLEALSK